MIENIVNFLGACLIALIVYKFYDWLTKWATLEEPVVIEIEPAVTGDVGYENIYRNYAPLLIKSKQQKLAFKHGLCVFQERNRID